MKRLLDIAAAAGGLVVLAPLLAVLSAAIWLYDRRTPLYVPPRVGRDGRPFRMIKLRTMVVGADRTKVDSTASDDPRITPVGRFMRRLKLDELPQLWNVLTGEMSLVGPRPNIDRETRLYSAEERRLLSIAPGITDIASIVFADEGEILAGHADANIAYNQLIRPYKSRLGLLYVDNASVRLDAALIVLTVVNSISRRTALERIATLVEQLGAPPDLVRVARRLDGLRPAPPPGFDSVVTSRG